MKSKKEEVNWLKNYKILILKLKLKKNWEKIIRIIRN
jgi:hypothetical protein